MKKRGICKNNLANVLTVSRIIMTFFLLCVSAFSPLFYIIYGLCGLTDILDGLVARSFKSASQLGAKLDSLADGILFMVMAIIILPEISLTPVFIGWLVGIVLLRLLALGITYKKFGKMTLIHTYGNKLTGLIVFLVPFILKSQRFSPFLFFACTIATISAFEEVIIELKSKVLNEDTKGIWNL